MAFASSRIARVGAAIVLSLGMTAGLASTALAATSANKLVVLLPGETLSTGLCTTHRHAGPPDRRRRLLRHRRRRRRELQLRHLGEPRRWPSPAATPTPLCRPANAALVNGTGTFSVTFKTAGSRTVTATDTAGSPLTAGTSAAVHVNPGRKASSRSCSPVRPPPPAPLPATPAPRRRRPSASPSPSPSTRSTRTGTS